MSTPLEDLFSAAIKDALREWLDTHEQAALAMLREAVQAAMDAYLFDNPPPYRRLQD